MGNPNNRRKETPQKTHSKKIKGTTMATDSIALSTSKLSEQLPNVAAAIASHVDARIKDEVKTHAASTSTASKKPRGKGYKSWLDGDFMSEKGVPPGHSIYAPGKSPSEIATLKSVAKVKSPVSQQKNPQPTALQKPQTWFTRYDLEKKDFIILSDRVERNLTRVKKYSRPDGTVSQTFSDEFAPRNYNFVEKFSKMTPEKQAQVMNSRHVEIFMKVALQDLENNAKNDGIPSTTAQSGVMDQLDRLGPGFTDKITNLQVTLNFVDDGTASTTIATKSEVALAGNRTAPEKFNGPVPSGAMFQLLEDLARRINTFPNLKKLAILLNIKSGGVRLPLSKEHFTMVLPFYDLNFGWWELKWSHEKMKYPVEVKGWPIRWMDSARGHIIQQRAIV